MTPCSTASTGGLPRWERCCQSLFSLPCSNQVLHHVGEHGDLDGGGPMMDLVLLGGAVATAAALAGLIATMPTPKPIPIRVRDRRRQRR